MGVTSFLLLSSLGLVISAQAQNCSTPIGGDNMSLKGNDILLTTFPEGTKVTFACNVGYESAGGSAVVTCSGGSWSAVRLTCQKRSCGSAGDVPNGDVHYPEGNEFGAKLVVTCNIGYRLVGNSQVLCGAQGWMNRLPECEVVACDPVVAPTNGTISPIKDSYSYREVIEYRCRSDLILSGSRTSVCSEDGTFKPAPPTCVAKVECKEPNIEHAVWSGGSRPPHYYPLTVTYKCKAGFTMKGASTLTCGLDGDWSPGLPTCEANPIPPKPTTPTTPTTTTTTTTTTKRPIITKKPTGDPDTTPPSNGGNARSVWLGVGLTFLIVSVLTVCGCYFCGVPAIIKEKRRSRRGLPDNVVPKDGEDVALS